MKLSHTFLNLAVFLCIEEQVAPGRWENVPRATAFLVLVEEGTAQSPYVVTAKHNIEATAGRDFFIRVNRATGGGFGDEPTNEDRWFCHDSADVAVSPFVPKSAPPFRLNAYRMFGFVQGDYTVDVKAIVGAGAKTDFGDRVPVAPGDEVIFVGLFVSNPGTRENLPVARFGHISRMPSEPILFQREDRTEVEVVGYLAECHSWGGHSGSPVFWHQRAITMATLNTPGGPMTMPTPYDMSALLGLVSGHFDIEREAVVQGDVLGKVTAAINAGMAVITPAEAIRELLMREDVVADRNERAKRAAEKKSKSAATFDSAFPPGEEEDEYQRFDDLVHHLANTPKPKPDESES